MAIRYTADLHFGHANAIRFDHRPFTDVEQMDAFLIQIWNRRVEPDDEVYILGDVCYHSPNPPEYYLRKLKGHKHLIIGNHDRKMLKNPKAMSYFESADDLLEIQDKNRQVILCHYPLAEWCGMFHGSYHVFGHIHGSAENEAQKYMMVKERAFNAGCMMNGYAPATLDEMIRMKEHTQKSGSIPVSPIRLRTKA